MIKKGHLIKDKYTIVEMLGDTESSNTYFATDKETGKDVIIKSLDFRDLSDWKLLEELEREVDVLKSIRHDRLPKYIEYFTLAEDDQEMRCLVYEYIRGYSLKELIESGKRFSYEETQNILLQVLETLDYLHNLTSQVIHRDVTPDNIIINENKEAYIIDFDTVKKLVGRKKPKTDTDEIIGTFGFIPKEQLEGKAFPQSDIYALGMTAINMLTGKEPNELPMKDSRPDYLNNKSVNPLDSVIYKMIDPDMNNRFSSAAEVIEQIKLIKKYQYSSDGLIKTNNTVTQATDTSSTDTYTTVNKSSRITVKSFQDSTSMFVRNPESVGLNVKRFSNFRKNVILHYTEKPGRLTILGILLLPALVVLALIVSAINDDAGFGIFLTAFLGSPVILILTFMFIIPNIKKSMKKDYVQFEDVEITVNPREIFVTNLIKKRKISDLKYAYISPSLKGEFIDLKITLKQVNGKSEFFTIPMLRKEEADEVSDFISQNIEIRKNL